MILGGVKILPPAGLKVSIGSDTEIGSVDVWVGSVGVNQIREAKAIGNESLMFGKGVHVNDACCCGISGVCKGQLILQPSRGHLAISVRVGQPTAIPWPAITFQCAVHPESASGADATCVAFDHGSITVNELPRDVAGVVRRLIGDNNQVTGYVRGKHPASVLNRAQTTWQELLFVSRGYHDGHVERGCHKRTRRSSRMFGPRSLWSARNFGWE